MLPNLGFPRQILEVNTVGGLHETHDESIASATVTGRKLTMAGSSESVSGNLSDFFISRFRSRRNVDRHTSRVTGFDQIDKRNN